MFARAGDSCYYLSRLYLSYLPSLPLPPTIILNTATTTPLGMDKLTSEVQAAIIANQNPADCDNARYFLWTMNGYGMGE